MVALNVRSQDFNVSSRLTIQNREIAEKTTVIRSLDWDRDRFDIEFDLTNGTTYNSFLIQGEKTALVDTSHQKFESLYLEALTNLIDFSTLDYLIISHTEPDHSGLVKNVLSLAPQVTIVGSKVAIQFLENMVHQSFNSLIVKSGETLDLGNGHELEFVSAPNLHWPDTIFTYDKKTHILYTCDVFGMHYCDDYLYDEEPDLLTEDFQYYYDCLMGPNARSVLAALKRIQNLDIQTVATGHGPLLHHHIPQWLNSYQQWSQEQAKTDNLVVVFYSEDYGYSEQIGRDIAQGLLKTGVTVDLVNLSETDPHEAREFVHEAKGLVIGMPSQHNAIAQTALSTILAAVHGKQAIGLFESGGGEDEPIYPLRNKFQEIGLTEAFSPILIKNAPTATTEKLAEEAGTDLGQWLTRDRTIKQMKSIDSSLEKALGRISGGLYLITVQKGEVSGAMLASWVTQASLEPLGVAIAVAKDRAIESLMQVDNTFVLNILEEGNYQGLMKHFLKRFPPGGDRFAGIKTHQSRNGSPILADALAYLECTVTSRLEASDHWIIYSTVQTGRLSKVEGVTAVHHRKVGNHY
ncbi:diflavin flavoprotein [Aphanothece sacrum]|uniref:Flavin reductase, FMN-binding protein n=1 Tax=Aphanothece sacrum FPU1 TaxID=1920663 RepID=A0A401INV1_APHSA|nr:diflavin flavoprotein [Aphanothece sacrum]GBF82907.1 flavin reductase, FMN-binding protein [Aphanothece sacrum FPU1]GBF85959.1 flavin reductase domain-containing FMN-binding protein [Aphanothece sacrum FPU3]